jgi:hypothetical protein
MKKIVLLFTGLSLFILSCDKSDEVASILPARFSIDIPEALSYGDIQNARIDETTLSGDLIYANLRVFIRIGEVSAQTVETIIKGIRRHRIDKPVEIKFRSDWDNRIKFFKVEEKVSAEGKIWDYALNAWDSQDSILAFQLYWNTNPIEGVAIMKVFDMNRQLGEMFRDWMYKIEYSEANANFEKQMTVSVTRPTNSEDNKWLINNLKMFVGKKGDEVFLHGNTNHPNIWLVDQAFSGGRNYAFVGKANIKQNIGVATVSLPPSSVNSVTDLLENYSIYNVVKGEVETAFNVTLGGIFDHLYQPYFVNTNAPGYFKRPEGFISSGSIVPNHVGFTSKFIDLSGLKPYLPLSVKELSIIFNQ